MEWVWAAPVVDRKVSVVHRFVGLGVEIAAEVGGKGTG